MFEIVATIVLALIIGGAGLTAAITSSRDADARHHRKDA